MADKATKENTKVGDFLMSTYGCTMHRASYWQVYRIQNTKVWLVPAESEMNATGYDAGHLKLVGPCAVVTGKELRPAKITSRGIKLAVINADGKFIAGDHYWDYLKKVEIGHSEYTYGD